MAMPYQDNEGPKMPKSVISTALKITTLAGTALLVQGCTQFRGHQGYVGDATLITSVQAGVDNKESVQSTLGRPTFTGQFGGNDWYYYARDTKQLAFRNPRPTAQTIVHVKFDNAGNVVAVNQRGMENVVRLNPESDKTPTLGRNTSFFEELFGNIGTVGAPGAGAPGGQGGRP
jgi:outer membrane protein assembly factor BamE (lipoprotein component of BamABCDE complex)